MSNSSKFGLGDILKDRITGYKGVAISRTQWLNGCVRYDLQAQELHEGKPVASVWFDEEQLFLVQEAAPRPVDASGGPQDDPSGPCADRRLP